MVSWRTTFRTVVEVGGVASTRTQMIHVEAHEEVGLMRMELRGGGGNLE